MYGLYEQLKLTMLIHILNRISNSAAASCFLAIFNITLRPYFISINVRNDLTLRSDPAEIIGIVFR